MGLFYFGRKFRRHKNKAKRINDLKKPETLTGGFVNKFQKWREGKDWSRWRINFIIGVFCLLWGALWVRAWHLQMIAGPHLANKAMHQHMTAERVAGKRGMIFDRNGQVLARSVESRSIYANPGQISNAHQTALILAPILNIPVQNLEMSLNKDNKRFIWLKRKVDDNTALAVRKANLPGIGLSKEYDRFYPFKHMAGQLLGFVGIDGEGLEGLEKSLDGTLGAMPVLQIVQRDAKGRKFYLDEGPMQTEGQNVNLTLDMRIQFLAEEAVAKVAKEFDARWSGALVVDVSNGDILAWAQYPFFNPNIYKQSTPQIYRNRLAADALEPGSTFKPLVMATALQEKKITPNTLIDCEGGKWVYKNFTIRDTSNQGILPASKVLRYSSNIGMAKIGQSLGARQFHKYLYDLGFGESNSLPVNNGRGILRQPRDWGEVDVMSTAFGQSISVTALQMAQAYLTLLNDGIYKPLRLIAGTVNVEEAPRQIFSAKNAAIVKDMMRDVVEESDGTGKRARIPGVEVAGKTGTAQKADARTKTYGEKRLASFIGFLPAQSPKYLILVFVDEPTRNQYGGVVAAPAFKEIATHILAQTGGIAETAVTKSTENSSKRKRGFKLAAAPDQPWLGTENVLPQKPQQSLRLPGHLAKAADKIPDVKGKSVRNAVELFARAGIVPELKGAGGRVIRQSPPAGSPWPAKDTPYILWLSEG